MCQALGFVIFMQGSPAPGLLCLHWACVLVPLLPHQTGQGLMYLSAFHTSVLNMEQLLKNLCVRGGLAPPPGHRCQPQLSPASPIPPLTFRDLLPLPLG